MYGYASTGGHFDMEGFVSIFTYDNSEWERFRSARANSSYSELAVFAVGLIYQGNIHVQ